MDAVAAAAKFLGQFPHIPHMCADRLIQVAPDGDGGFAVTLTYKGAEILVAFGTCILPFADPATAVHWLTMAVSQRVRIACRCSGERTLQVWSGDCWRDAYPEQWWHWKRRSPVTRFLENHYLPFDDEETGLQISTVQATGAA